MLKFNLRNRKRGSILVEYLITLYIFLLLIEVFNSCLVIAERSLKHNSLLNEEVSLIQLRRTLLLSYDIENKGNSLEYEYQDRRFILNEINNNLIVQPGTQIVIMDINNLYFYEVNNNIYISYMKNEELYEKALVKKWRLY